ncbi:OmpA family protein [Prosthecobacter sp.]|uniref:OmpA family protein n=1 Tax=Prosthecobacter sp. TaxID=1965333 RepID=UPI003784E15E
MKTSAMYRTASASLLALILLTLTAAAQRAPAPQVSLERKRLDLQEQKLTLQKQILDLDQQQLALERQILEVASARKALQVEETATSLTMKLEGDVLFDFDKAAVRPDAEVLLDKVATVLAEFPGGKVTVGGYTDSKGSDKVNLDMSQRRADAVKSWLVKKKGIPEKMITTKGFGESNPVAPNTNADGSDNPEGRQQNRRVQITVEK